MARTGRIASDDAGVLTVGEVMISRPKTQPGDALVADVRRAFENPSIRTVLLADDGIFRGAIERERLPDDAADDAPAAGYADTEPVTATPATPIPDAIKLLEDQPEPRLIVLDEDGATLRGLLCFNRSSDEFCVR
ncbi:MAG TPA: CBS domain-containing protein [Solirubrobacteraceae bacterium]|jgi:CBS domain-containing protein|nr:CBS domain-containing protein [Solirubrobacteraceae bacterium]